MAQTDRHLVDPTADELVDALDQARRRANRGLPKRKLNQDRAHFARFVRAARQREGKHVWAAGRTVYLPTARVGVAWWTDYLGRRHWRVLGWSRPGEFHERQAALLSGPPLQVIYPEHVFVLRRNGREELAVLCDCAAFGSPAALAWMGTTCGPCYDRQTEVETPPAERLRLGPDVRDAPWRCDLTFTPDGRSLVYRVGGGTQVYLWDRARGERRRVSRPHTRSDGPFVLLPDGHRLVVQGARGLELRDLTTGRTKVLLREAVWTSAMTLHPDGRTLFLGGTASRLFDLNTRQTRALPALDRVRTEPTGSWYWANYGVVAARFLRGGRDLMVADQEGGLYLVGDVRRRPELTALPPPPPLPDAKRGPEADDGTDFGDYHLAIAPDEQRLALVEPQDVTRVRVRDNRTGQWWRTDRGPGPCLALAFAPDNRTLVTAAPTGTTFWDLVGRRAVVTLSCRPSPVCALAFSPDGRWLACGCQNGSIRLLPWAVLADGGASFFNAGRGE